jgi:heme exporter protein C
MLTLRTAYKALAIALLAYGLVFGLWSTLPRVGDLGQTSRNLFYHLPMWFAMYLMMALSLGYSVAYLLRGRPAQDDQAAEFARQGVWFGLLGLVTGIVWSRVTWGAALRDSDPTAWWPWDPKQTLALAAVLMYLAYFVLRGALDEPRARARVAAVYNVFAGVSLFPLTYMIPRALQSLHPGGEDGNPFLDSRSIAADYRLILYPTVLGFMLLGVWMVELRTRRLALERQLLSRQLDN